ncbi:hypothetical protein D915_005235 [Fasciola hepatica]|uniref:Uncharacterized protein n=1 Tax=Fasciola hepatica TaxID=6192 RepID=A0A4E0S0V6_FASHE|nr:hypothetical protein D915_005235 [Fasciola hepatica]
MKHVPDKEHEHSGIQRLFNSLRRKKSPLKGDLFPQSESISVGKLPSVMDSDINPDLRVSTETTIPVNNCDTSGAGVKLPVRSPSASHAKFLTRCVPIHGLHRSASSPRQSARKSAKSVSPMARIDQTGNQDLESSVSENIKQLVSDPTVDMSSDLWDNEGSFKWRRVRPSATFHHTSLSGMKSSNLWMRNKHISESENTDTPNLFSPFENPSTEATYVFRDPMLEELDAELPVPPPPPPRACPPWLKSALAKQQQSQSSKPATMDPDISDPGTDLTRSQTADTSIMTGIGSGLNKQKSFSFEHDRYGLRIYPVMQDGVKISDTHYWLLDPPQSHRMRPRFPSAEADQISCSPPLEAGDYLNVPPGVSLRREVSEPNRQALNNMHYHMVQRMMQDVPEANEAECQAVLIGASYRYEEARKRLKFELLRRLGHFSRSFYKRVLQNVDWDLPLAMNKVRTALEMQKTRDLSLFDPDRPKSSAGVPFPHTYSSNKMDNRTSQMNSTPDVPNPPSPDRPNLSPAFSGPSSREILLTEFRRTDQSAHTEQS